MRKMTRLFIAVAASTLFAATPVHAENWPQWRGPHFDGSSAETNLPDKLDPKANVVWSTDLPGSSSGTPVTVGDKIFLPALNKKTKKLTAIAINRADGKIAW